MEISWLILCCLWGLSVKKMNLGFDMFGPCLGLSPSPPWQHRLVNERL